MRVARKSYLTDLTNEQWDVLKEFIPTAKSGGRHRKVDPREIVITSQFDNAENFSERLAKIMVNQKWGYINTLGGTGTD